MTAVTTERPTTPNSRLDRDALATLFDDAHTAYEFTDEPVSGAELVELYERVRLAPTAMNSQPLRITYLVTDDAKARLLPHLAEGNRAKAASAPVVAILAADTDFHEHLPRLWPPNPAARDGFAADADRRADAARFNAAIGAGYFILGARAMGLDVGPMGGFNAAGVNAEFFADRPWRSILVVNLGHASANGVRARNPRLDVDEAVTFL
jgi:3-hydroxypropanoate dehydrogenase